MQEKPHSHMHHTLILPPRSYLHLWSLSSFHHILLSFHLYDLEPAPIFLSLSLSQKHRLSPFSHPTLYPCFSPSPLLCGQISPAPPGTQKASTKAVLYLFHHSSLLYTSLLPTELDVPIKTLPMDYVTSSLRNKGRFSQSLRSKANYTPPKTIFF